MQKSFCSSAVLGVVLSLGVLGSLSSLHARAAESTVPIPQCTQVGSVPGPIGISPRLGSFDRMMMSPYRPTLEDGGPNSVYFGLPYHDTWISAIVRNAAGQTYWVMQTDNVDGQDRALALKAQPNGKYMEPPKELLNSARLVDFTQDSIKGLKYTADAVDIGFTDKDFTWKDKAGVDLKGSLAAPGIQLVMPWRRGSQSGVQMYFAQHFFADGTILGEPVSGYVLFEHNYDHVPWRNGAFSDGRGGLVTFTNQYDDGTVETGYFFCGGALRVAMMVNGKGEEVINTHLVNATTKLNADGVFDSAIYTLGDGSQWEFKRDPGASVKPPEPVAGEPEEMSAHRTSFGRFTRVGEKREVIRWWTSSVAGALR